MKSLLAGLAIAGLMTAPALADGMDNAVGNTVRVIIDEAGHGFDVYLDEGGAYSDSLGRSGASWSWADDQLCIQPPAGPDGAVPEASCGPWNESLAPGGSWQTSDWSQDGTEVTFSILDGRGHEAPTPPPAPAPAE